MYLVDKYRQLRKWCRTIYLYGDKRNRMNLHVPFLKKMKWNVRGFTDEEIVIFKLNDLNWKNYISKWNRNKLEDVNDGFWATLLGKKLLFEKVFGSVINVPHIYWWNCKGRFYSPDTGEPIDISNVMSSAWDRMVVKPSSSVGGGSGVHLLEKNGEQLLIDGSAITIEALIDTLEKMDNYIAVQYVYSAEYSTKIYPKSTNSIRIVTTYDAETDSAEPMFAMHRFGTDFSKPVDNISNGGIFSVIDLKTGLMTKAKSKFDINAEYSVHPDSGAQIEGIAVPSWKELLETVLNWHKRMPQYCFLAWDIVINDSGIPYVLEINRGSDLGVQMIQPMKNERLGKWMKRKGLLG